MDLMAQQKSGDCSNLDFGRRGSKKWMNDYFFGVDVHVEIV